MNPNATQQAKKTKPLMGRLFGMFGKKDAPKQTQEKPVMAKPAEPKVAAKKEEAKPVVKNASFFSQLADGQSVIDGTPRSFTMNGHTQTIMFTFRRNMLDGKPYRYMTDDSALDILTAVKNGNAFAVEAGSFGKAVSLHATEEELNAIIRTLLSTGTHEITDANGKKAAIVRN